MSKDKALKFIGHFLSWYQESTYKTEVETHLHLIKLVNEASGIQEERIKEIYKNYKPHVEPNVHDKPTKQLVRQCKRILKK